MGYIFVTRDECGNFYEIREMHKLDSNCGQQSESNIEESAKTVGQKREWSIHGSLLAKYRPFSFCYCIAIALSDLRLPSRHSQCEPYPGHKKKSSRKTALKSFVPRIGLELRSSRADAI